MIKTLILIPIYAKYDEQVIRLIISIKDTIEDYPHYLFAPVSQRSYSVQLNDGIMTASIFGCKYLCVIDSDAWWTQKDWLRKLEYSMDNSDFGLLMDGPGTANDSTIPIETDETQLTPYIASTLCVYRITNNILLDTDYIYHQSSEVDWCREHRRQGLKVGLLPSVHIDHKWDDNASGNPNYNRWKLRNEHVFNQKWGTICHINPPDWSTRDKWRGIYNNTNMDNLKEVSDQYLSISPYFESPLFHNDCQYMRKKNISPWDYFAENELLPENMSDSIRHQLCDLSTEILTKNVV